MDDALGLDELDGGFEDGLDKGRGEEGKVDSRGRGGNAGAAGAAEGVGKGAGRTESEGLTIDGTDEEEEEEDEERVEEGGGGG